MRASVRIGRPLYPPSAYLVHSINTHTSLISAIAKMSTFVELVPSTHRPHPVFVACTKQTGRVLYYACHEKVLETLCAFPGLGSGFDLVSRGEVEEANIIRSDIPLPPRRACTDEVARAVLIHAFEQFGSQVPLVAALQELMRTISAMRNYQLSIPNSCRNAAPSPEIAVSEETGVVLQLNDDLDEDLVLETNDGSDSGFGSDSETGESLCPQTCSPARRCHRINCGPCNKRLSKLCVVMLDGARDKPPFPWGSFVDVPPSLATMCCAARAESRETAFGLGKLAKAP